MGETPLVGRATELTVLERLAQCAADGYATVALVTGSAGMGKSALLSAFADASRSFTVIRLSGDETERDLPYGTLSGLIGGSSEWASPVRCRRGRRQGPGGALRARPGDVRGRRCTPV